MSVSVSAAPVKPRHSVSGQVRRRVQHVFAQLVGVKVCDPPQIVVRPVRHGEDVGHLPICHVLPVLALDERLAGGGHLLEQEDGTGVSSYVRDLCHGEFVHVTLYVREYRQLVQQNFVDILADTQQLLLTKGVQVITFPKFLLTRGWNR